MTKKKTSLIKLIRLWGIIFIISFGGSLIIFDIISSYMDFNSQAEKMRIDYITNQKQMIKREVEKVADLIKKKKTQSDKLEKEMIKLRVYEAYSIAKNIYKQNKNLKIRKKIEQMIINALRPIRFGQGGGYMFAVTLDDGVAMLFSDKPELEGVRILDIKDKKTRNVVYELIRIAKKSGEGFHEYYWTKPGLKGNNYKKISFVKKFEPYNWYIGTGLYASDIIVKLKTDLLLTISKIRFGKEGYIFVNRLNGETLVSNGKLYSGRKKMWEIFNKDPKKIRELFEKEYKAALKPEGDYIHYSWNKLTAPEKEVTKTSFIYGIPELKWLIGAGVYLDDVEADIVLMEAGLIHKIKIKTIYFILIVTGIILIFIFLLNLMTNRLKNDYKLFLSFFNKTVESKEGINRDLIQFIELDRMAENANKMRNELQKSEENYRDLFNNNPISLWEEDFSEVKNILDNIKNKGIIVSEEYFDKNPDVISDCLAAIKILNINKATLDILKYRTVEELKKNLARTFNEKTHETIKNEFIAIANDGTYFSEESELVRSDRKIIDVIVQFQVIGSYKKILFSIIDITERKLIEEELKKNQMLKSVGTLAGGIAHDFNNILMGLFGNISLAKKKLSKDHQSFRHLEEAENSMSWATSLTKQLLTFSKGGSPVKEDISIGQLVEEVVRFDLSGSNVKPVFKLAEDLWLADVDKGQIQQVFSNLIINANQAMSDGGHLYITLENAVISKGLLPGLKEGRYIRATMIDEGTGIDQKHIDRIFDPYFSTKQTGSGLGLATVYSIINKHGGHISIDSELGKGTEFILYLPASEVQKIHEKKHQKAQFSIIEQRGRILVMDDEDIVLEVTSEMLKDLGYSVETAHDGSSVMKMYKQSMTLNKPFDAVIMDLTIPGGTGGKEAIKELLLIDPNVKAIVSSGYADDPVMANFSKYGFKGIMAKPYVMDQLQNVLNRVLNG